MNLKESLEHLYHDVLLLLLCLLLCLAPAAQTITLITNK